MDPVTALARTPRRPRRTEYLVTAGLVVWAVLEAVAPTGDPVSGRPPTVALALAVAWSLPALAMRVAPLPALGVVLGAFLADALASGAEPPGAMPLPAILLLTFACGLWVRGTAASATGGMAAAGVVLGVQVFGYYEAIGPQFAVAAFFVAGAWTSGRVLRHRARALLLAERERARAEAAAETAEREAAEAARLAVQRERASIARELHDVVAHAVSVVAVQAGAAEDLVGTDPERARQHIGHARDGARQAMVEMRRMLQVLDPEPDAVREPLPGTDRLADLVEAARGAGAAVELAVRGDPVPLPPALDLAVYRVVQESLTNARRHASGAPVTVLVRHGAREIGIEVRNGPGTPVPFPVDGGGRGLAGMTERVRVFGGTLAAGPDGPGGTGFAVRALLPVPAEEAAG